jgi:hypothetical protein
MLPKKKIDAKIIYRIRKWKWKMEKSSVMLKLFTGYGSTTPQTTAGKAAVVLYGFFGCSGNNQIYA